MRATQDYIEADEVFIPAVSTVELALDFRPQIGVDVLAEPCWRWLIRGLSSAFGDTVSLQLVDIVDIEAQGIGLGSMHLANTGGKGSMRPLEVPLPDPWDGILLLAISNRSGGLVDAQHFVTALVRREPKPTP